jgi:L-serine dehydratase
MRNVLFRRRRFCDQGRRRKIVKDNMQLPFPINTADDIQHWCIKTGLHIHEIVMENEHSWRTEKKPRTAC